jgi:hypothetical protein
MHAVLLCMACAAAAVTASSTPGSLGPATPLKERAQLHLARRFNRFTHWNARSGMAHKTPPKSIEVDIRPATKVRASQAQR